MSRDKRTWCEKRARRQFRLTDALPLVALVLTGLICIVAGHGGGPVWTVIPMLLMGVFDVSIWIYPLPMLAVTSLVGAAVSSLACLVPRLGIWKRWIEYGFSTAWVCVLFWLAITTSESYFLTVVSSIPAFVAVLAIAVTACIDAYAMLRCAAMLRPSESNDE